MRIHCSFLEEIKSIILKDQRIGKYYVTTFPNSRFTLTKILEEIVYILKSGVSWRECRSSLNFRTIHYHYRRYVKANIFKKLFTRLRNRYLRKSSIRLISVDTTYITNKYGRNKLSRNTYYKSKKGNKISVITDSYGIPLSVLINKGSVHDNSFVTRHLQDLRIREWSKKPKFLLADKIYEWKKLRSRVQEHEISLMIKGRKRAKVKYFYDPKIYHYRIFVEHAFQKLKRFKRLPFRFDRKFSHYQAWVYLAFSLVLQKY